MTYLFYVSLIKDYLNYNIEISFLFQIPKGQTKNIQNKKMMSTRMTDLKQKLFNVPHQTTNLYSRAIVSIVTLRMFVLLWSVVL